MKITLKKILLLVAGLLGIVAFVMMFLPAVGAQTKALNGKTSVDYIEGIKVLFGSKDSIAGIVSVETKGAVGAFIGYLLALLGGIAVVVPMFVIKDAKLQKIITLVGAALLVVATVLIFLEKVMYVGANELGDLESDYLKYVLGPGPIIGGLAAAFGAACGGISLFVKE